MEEVQPDLLTDFIEQTQFVRASAGKRFLNFLIDYIVFLVLVVAVVVVWTLASPTTVDLITNNSGADFVDRILTFLLYGCYMSAIEAITNGRSLGKLITGTKAINEDGSNITVSTAVKRGFSRAVPFEVFSALGNPCNPWHDKWNHTYVIDIKQSYIIPKTQ